MFTIYTGWWVWLISHHHNYRVYKRCHHKYRWFVRQSNTYEWTELVWNPKLMGKKAWCKIQAVLEFEFKVFRKMSFWFPRNSFWKSIYRKIIEWWTFCSLRRISRKSHQRIPELPLWENAEPLKSSDFLYLPLTQSFITTAQTELSGVCNFLSYMETVDSQVFFKRILNFLCPKLNRLSDQLLFFFFTRLRLYLIGQELEIEENVDTISYPRSSQLQLQN